VTVAAAPRSRLSFGGAVRSEFRKMSTVRAMWWVAIVSAILGPFAALTTDHGAPPLGEEAAWTMAAAASAVIGPWLIVAIYAALQATGEWSSGQYRVSFATVPRRNLWLAAKAAAVGIYAAAVALIVLVLSVLVTLAQSGATVDWTAGYTWQVLLGGPVAFALTAALSVAIGALVRSSGVAVTIVVGLLVVLPFAGVFGAFGLDWVGHITSYLPSGAADAIVGSGAFGPAADDLGVGPGVAVLVAWVAVASIAASVAMNNRDA